MKSLECLSNNGNFIILFLTTNFLRRVGSINFITSLSISTMGGQTMNINENEYKFLSYVYTDICGDDETNFFKYRFRKRLDDYFISHLTKKKIRMSNRLVHLLLYILKSESATDAITNEFYLNSEEVEHLGKKLEKYLGIS